MQNRRSGQVLVTDQSNLELIEGLNGHYTLGLFGFATYPTIISTLCKWISVYFKVVQNLVANHYEKYFDMIFHLKKVQWSERG